MIYYDDFRAFAKEHEDVIRPQTARTAATLPIRVWRYMVSHRSQTGIFGLIVGEVWRYRIYIGLKLSRGL